MSEERITPKNVEELEDDQIFVFGSNRSGIHGSCAAEKAMNMGAVWKQPEGLQGNTYAIPTKDFNVKDTLSLDMIKMHVDLFLEFAKSRSDLTFLVTEIGCGYAGYKPSDISPMFKEAKNINNIHLPESFWKEIKK